MVTALERSRAARVAAGRPIVSFNVKTRQFTVNGKKTSALQVSRDLRAGAGTGIISTDIRTGETKVSGRKLTGTDQQQRAKLSRIIRTGLPITAPVDKTRSGILTSKSNFRILDELRRITDLAEKNIKAGLRPNFFINPLPGGLPTRPSLVIKNRNNLLSIFRDRIDALNQAKFWQSANLALTGKELASASFSCFILF